MAVTSNVQSTTMQAWTDPEGPRKLRLTEFQYIRLMQMTRLSVRQIGRLYLPLTQEIFLLNISVTDWFNKRFPVKSCPLWVNVKEKNSGTAGQATDDNTAPALGMLDNKAYQHPLTTKAAKTRLDVRLYAHCLNCCVFVLYLCLCVGFVNVISAAGRRR